MLSIEVIRREPDRVKRAAELKGESAPIDEILELDHHWRSTTARAEAARAQQNALSKVFGRSRDPSMLPEMKRLSEQAGALMSEASELLAARNGLLLVVPNLFADDVPIGRTEEDNVVLRSWGDKPQFAFAPRTHYDLGEALGIIDFERAGKVAGSRFAFLSGAGARLGRALVQFFLDLHTSEHGYVEMQPPFLVNSASMLGTANLPKFGDDAFKLEGRDLWLVPTAEVPVTNYHRDEILDSQLLPLRYAAYSPCFRSEAGAAGKDTRGYIRQHQFEKVELVKVTTPADSLEEFEALTRDAESVLQRLGLHYRVLSMCSGDMGFAQYKKYDLEAWCPGLGRYLEVSSCSLFNDFQARRANIRFRAPDSAEPLYVHTINGSGLATIRTWDAVVESYQRPDGGVDIPPALVPYMGGLDVIRRP
ncbi:MAG TPA: serine--tRNA ligase [Candidatus Acidoferrales bacterium]|nr:serine--tRNA ligase [Candidatus Acidoferrales bacterium]